MLGGLVVVLLIVLAVLVVPLLADNESEPAGEPSVTGSVTPTPPEPIDRDTSTRLLEALPDEVDGYAVTAQEETEPPDPDALESWQLTYTGAEGAVTLRVAQWEEAEEATEALTDLTDGLEPIDSGAVEVDGEEAGRFVVVEADGGPQVVWTNSTVVLLVEGADVETATSFYLAYPL